MTANDLRVRLLEAMGWTDCVPSKYYGWDRAIGKEPENGEPTWLPDLNDSLVRQARAAICTTPERRKAFIQAMAELCGVSQEWIGMEPMAFAWRCIHATADQQARALVAVLAEGDANL